MEEVEREALGMWSCLRGRMGTKWVRTGVETREESLQHKKE